MNVILNVLRLAEIREIRDNKCPRKNQAIRYHSEGACIYCIVLLVVVSI